MITIKECTCVTGTVLSTCIILLNLPTNRHFTLPDQEAEAQSG